MKDLNKKRVAIILTLLLITTMVVVVGLGFIILRQADTHYNTRKDNDTLKKKLAKLDKKLSIKMSTELECEGEARDCRKAVGIIRKELSSCIERLLDNGKLRPKSPRKLKGNDKI